jgi:hypothetical protein
MRRRIVSLVLLLAVVLPMAAGATHADMDPNGLTTTGVSADWLDDVLNCPECMAAFDRLYEILDELEHFDPVVVPEASTADELFNRLDTLGVAEAVARVTDDLAYQQWGLCQKLLRVSREHWFSDPVKARDYATVAVAVADRLHPESYNGEWVSDLRAKVNALRGARPGSPRCPPAGPASS